jgi:hypothetical protein
MDKDKSANSVTIGRAVGSWEVAVVENGKGEVHSFASQHVANNFATSNMVRLNLDHIHQNFSEQKTGRSELSTV